MIHPDIKKAACVRDPIADQTENGGLRCSAPETDPSETDPPKDESSVQQPAKHQEKPTSKTRPVTGFKPIIMCLAFVVIVFGATAQTGIQGAVRLGIQYTDNVFHLSDYDFDRFQTNHPNLDYVNTTDDLTLSARLDLAYPLRYRWWRITPSVTASHDQTICNTEKYNPKFLTRLRVDRYHWNATILYGYYPHIYVRSYIDNDGTGKLEKYSYECNLYRADANVHLLKNGSLRLHYRFEEYYYNQYFTEFDGTAQTTGLGWRHRFPIFTLNAQYQFRSFDNDERPMHDDRDSSYESDIYELGITMRQIPLTDSKSSKAKWCPALRLGYEERFFQSDDSWYGGRYDRIYTTNANILLTLTDKININLDYTHVFRNVDSPNALVRDLREYNENRLSVAAEYKF